MKREHQYNTPSTEILTELPTILSQLNSAKYQCYQCCWRYVSSLVGSQRNSQAESFTKSHWTASCLPQRATMSALSMLSDILRFCSDLPYGLNKATPIYSPPCNMAEETMFPQMVKAQARFTSQSLGSHSSLRKETAQVIINFPESPILTTHHRKSSILIK